MSRTRSRIFHRLPFVIRTAVATFVRSPTSSLPLLLAISLGIGANASVIAFVNGLARSISPATPSIVSIFYRDKTHSAGTMTRGEYQLLKEQDGIFSWVDAARVLPKTVKFDDQADLARVAQVTPHLTSTVGLPMAQGAFLSYQLWQSYFGSNSYLPGHIIRMDDADVPVLGITPDHIKGLYWGQPVDIWRTVANLPPGEDDRDVRDLWIVAQLRSGVSLDEAQARNPFKDHAYVVAYRGALPAMAGAVSRIGTILDLAAAGVFVIACLVVASLLLGYALNRVDTMTIQRFLGASRLNFATDRLADCAVIFIAGGILGLLLAACTAHLIPGMLFAEDAERLNFQASPMRIAAASLLSGIVIALCACIPVFAATADYTWNPLFNTKARLPKLVPYLRTILAVGQIATCCTITIVTLCIIDNLHASFKTDAAKALGELTLITVEAPRGLQNDMGYFNGIEKVIKSQSQATAVAWTAQLSGAASMWRSFRFPRNVSRAQDLEMAASGLSEILGSLHDAPVEGRVFRSEDMECDDVVINDAGAARLFGKNTVGTTLKSVDGNVLEIIGVVGQTSNAMSGRSKLPPIYYNDSAASTHIPNGPHRYTVLQTVSSHPIALNVNFVSQEYIRVLGLPLIAGTWFPSRVKVNACEKFGVINQEAADLYFTGNPIGSFIVDDRGVRTQIIGVVRSDPVGVLDPLSTPTLFLPMGQEHPRRMTLLIRGLGRDRSDSALRRTIEAVPGGDKAAPEIRTTSSRLTESSLSPLRIATLLLSISTAIAYFLTAIALITTQANTERQRRLDSALRIAMGASSRHIFRDTLAETGRVALSGVLLGTLGSILVLHVLGHNLAVPTRLPLLVWIVTPLATIASLMVVSAIATWKAIGLQPYALLSKPNIRL